MAKIDQIRDLVAPLVADGDADLYDVTLTGDKLVVAVSRRGGIDLDVLTGITRALNSALDEADLIGGSYTLEVTSPGLERPLRTPEHFVGAIGEVAAVRLRPGLDGERRLHGTIDAVEGASVTVTIDEANGADRVGDVRTISVDDVERARTVFSWGPAPKPGSKKSPPSDKKAR